MSTFNVDFYSANYRHGRALNNVKCLTNEESKITVEQNEKNNKNIKSNKVFET